MMSEDIVETEWREDGVKTIYLNRPDIANAINRELVAALMRELITSYNDATKLLVIRGRGRHFCSGFDRSMMASATRVDHATLGVEIEAMLQTVAAAPFVTLAHVEGAAVGAGADLVVACDYRVAAADAVFGFPGFNLLGVSLGNSRLAARIGPDHAMKMILQSERIDADTAHRRGLVTHRMEGEELPPFIDQLAAAIADLPKATIRHIKQSIEQGNGRSFGYSRYPEGQGAAIV